MSVSKRWDTSPSQRVVIAKALLDGLDWNDGGGRQVCWRWVKSVSVA